MVSRRLALSIFSEILFKLRIFRPSPDHRNLRSIAMSRKIAFMRRSTNRLLLSTCFAVALTSTAFAWGAIAVDDSYEDDDIGFGYSTGYDSNAEASASALEECKKADNANCKVVLVFKTCGALASLKRKFSVGEGPTKQAAEQTAMKACGPATCKVMASQCEGN
jgi:hypothetical protein